MLAANFLICELAVYRGVVVDVVDTQKKCNPADQAKAADIKKRKCQQRRKSAI
jgi:hypothetical protein